MVPWETTIVINRVRKIIDLFREAGRVSPPNFSGSFPSPVVFSRLPLHLLVSGWFGLFWSVSESILAKIKLINFRTSIRAHYYVTSQLEVTFCARFFNGKPNNSTMEQSCTLFHVSFFKLLELSSTTFLFILMF